MNSFSSPHYDRIAKISEKLNSLPATVTNDRSSRFDVLETRLSNIEQNHNDAIESLGRKLGGLTDEVSQIKASVEEERIAREQYINDKVREV
jgi:hypothetical protein